MENSQSFCSSRELKRFGTASCSASSKLRLLLLMEEKYACFYVNLDLAYLSVLIQYHYLPSQVHLGCI